MSRFKELPQRARQRHKARSKDAEAAGARANRFFDEVLERAKWGEVTDAEIETVVRELKNPVGRADKYVLIYILGRAERTEHEQLVASFLASKDSDLVSIALKTLCFYWDGFSAKYVDQILRLLDVHSWDCAGLARLGAIFCAGEHLSEAKDLELLTKLWNIVNDTTDDLRSAAFAALASAVGTHARDIQDLDDDFDLETDADPQVVEKVKARLRDGG